MSPSQVIVRHLVSGTRITLRSQFGHELLKLRVQQDRFLVGHTTDTLLLGDLETCKLSEVPWVRSPMETGVGARDKFVFDNERCALVYAAGELQVIEYGRNEIIGACRTEHMSPHLISVRVDERPPRRGTDIEGAAFGGVGDPTPNRKIAFLLDAQTVRVLDLATGLTAATVTHDTKVGGGAGWRAGPEGACRGAAASPHSLPPARTRTRTLPHPTLTPAPAPRSTGWS